jgi:HSP20 family protein
MAIERWDPFRELDLLTRLVPQHFGRALSMPEAELAVREWAPSADISEKPTEYVIRAELPAVRKEDAKVTVEGDVITISGERKEDKEEKDEKFVRRETFRGSFSRSFRLPEDADTTRISAESKDGVLTVRVPRQAAAKPARREITVE